MPKQSIDVPAYEKELVDVIVSTVNDHCFIKMTKLIAITAQEWVYLDIDIISFIWKCVHLNLIKAFSYWDENTKRYKTMLFSNSTKIEVKGV